MEPAFKQHLHKFNGKKLLGFDELVAEGWAPKFKVGNLNSRSQIGMHVLIVWEKVVDEGGLTIGI